MASGPVYSLPAQFLSPTPEAADTVIRRLDFGLGKLRKAARPALPACGDGCAVVCAGAGAPGFSVANERALHEMLTHAATARDLLQRVLGDGTGVNREQLQLIFGDCTRIAKIQAISEAAQELVARTRYAQDKRLKECLKNREAVESVLTDCGLRRKLERAIEEAREEERQRAIARTNTAVSGATPSESARAHMEGLAAEEAELASGTEILPEIAEIAEAVEVKVEVAAAEAAAAKRLALQLRVVSASGLALPEYRVGDVAVNTVGRLVPFMNKMDLSRVYAEIAFAGKSVKTSEAVASKAEKRAVAWESETHVMSVEGRPKRGLKLEVMLRDARGVQSWLRGDPVIGEGYLMGLGDLFRAPGKTMTVDMDLMTRNYLPRSAGFLRLELSAVPDV